VIDERDRQTIVRRYSERFDQFGLRESDRFVIDKDVEGKLV
jgi:hypothetical protein